MISNDWQIVLTVVYIFVFMAIAKYIKKLGVLKSIIIPTSLLGGFLGLIAGPEVLGIIHYDIDVYGKVVFHFLGIGFVALTLANKSDEQQTDSVTSGLFILATYCFQGVIGMILVLLLSITIKPDLFFGLGLMLPLSFGQGPGFAYSIGSSWDQILPYNFVTQYGLTLATSGFFVGGFIGVILMNYYMKKYNLKATKLNDMEGVQQKNLTISSIKEINFFDMLTTQISAIAIVYLFTFIIITILSGSLELLGTIGSTIASLIRGFNYLFGILCALLLKKILNFLHKRGHRSKELIDSYLMQNIAALSFNIMITASVMAISLSAIKDYWELLLTLVIGGGVFSYFFIVLLGKRVFKQTPFHYILAMFGMLTGTASTGIALLRGVDPDLETDVANNLVLGSSVAAPLGIPLMVLLGFPTIGYTTGDPKYYYISFFGILFYLLIIVGILLFRSRKTKK